MGHKGVRTITKKELSERIADTTGQSRTAVRLVLQTFLDEVVQELGQGSRIELRGFGVFETNTRAPRTARNPHTRQQIRIPQRRNVKFKPGKKMRDMVEKDHAPPEPITHAEPMPEPKTMIVPDTSCLGEAIPVNQDE